MNVCASPWWMFSTVRDIITVGDTISTFEDAQYCGGKTTKQFAYYLYRASVFPPKNCTSSTVLMVSLAVLMISTTVLNILRCTDGISTVLMIFPMVLNILNRAEG